MSGHWQIPVPPTVSGGGLSLWRLASGINKTKAGALVNNVPAGGASNVVNLLTLDDPTIMQTWLLENIRIPVAVFAQTTAKPAGAVIVTVYVVLKLGGLVVWSAELEVPMSGVATEEKVKFGNVIAAADLVNPIEVNAGRSLTLELNASPNVETDNLEVIGGEELRSGEAGGTQTLAQGSISYSTRDLTGHRTL